MNVIIGARSRLGRSLAQFLSPNKPILLERAIYQEWWRDNSADKISFFFEDIYKKRRTHPNEQSIQVFVPAGVLDPSLSEQEHHHVNYLLAKNIIDGVGRIGFRTVTFGTVMETLIGAQTKNPYIKSKTHLSDYVNNYCVQHESALHIRLHTLYGVGLPSSFMFLGQILHALLHQIDFNMSPGQQLREYHHIDDDVCAFMHLLPLKKCGVVELSHGQPLTLKAIAHYVFSHFDCLNLLKIGVLAEPPKDNNNFVFQRPMEIGEVVFRDTLPAIVTYLQSCLKQSKESVHV